MWCRIWGWQGCRSWRRSWYRHVGFVLVFRFVLCMIPNCVMVLVFIYITIIMILSYVGIDRKLCRFVFCRIWHMYWIVIIRSWVFCWIRCGPSTSWIRCWIPSWVPRRFFCWTDGRVWSRPVCWSVGRIRSRFNCWCHRWLRCGKFCRHRGWSKCWILGRFLCWIKCRIGSRYRRRLS